MSKKIRIYSAAALFSGRETLFNVGLVERLEEKGYQAFLPQRDGFEFGNLTASLKGKVKDKEIGEAVQQIIYFLDMGLFIPKSDVVIANLDEPQDEGVIVELSYAKLMGKFNIGYRTDVRSPYGNISDPLGGIHFFPAFQCDKFIRHYMPAKSGLDGKVQMDELAAKIHETIIKRGISPKKVSSYALENPHIKQILDSAKLLFAGIEDLHSIEGLNEISRRYGENRERLSKVYPTIDRGR